MRQGWVGGIAALTVVGFVAGVRGSTLAYWSFDHGTAATTVPHPGLPGYFVAAVPDGSGNNNSLSVWDTSFGGYQYRAQHPNVPGNAANGLSIKNIGTAASAFTVDRFGTDGVPGATPSVLNTATFARWTVEASYKPEQVNDTRVIVGRDSRGLAIGNASYSSFALGINPDNTVFVQFTDVAGEVHFAGTGSGFANAYTFVNGSDPQAAGGQWMNLAGLSDGHVLTLYCNGVEVARNDMTKGSLYGRPASSNTAMAAAGDPRPAGDLASGGWSVGRGMYAGQQNAFGLGLIDEVRISDRALAYNELLSVVPEPATLVAGLSAVVTLAIRRRVH